MSVTPVDALTRLLNAALRELRRLFAPLAARLRRFLATLRGAALLPAQGVTLSRLFVAGLRALTGAAPGLQFPAGGGDGARTSPPLPALLRATVRASAGLVTPAEADKAAAWDRALAYRAPDGITLSPRLWRNGQLIRRRVDEAITQSVRAGLAPGEVADRIEGLLIGTAERGARPSNLARLIVTEATRAHGAATLALADREGAAVRWTIRTAHALTDQCGRNARADHYGLGAGVYPVGAVPRFPDHPWCRCALTLVRVTTQEAA